MDYSTICSQTIKLVTEVGGIIRTERKKLQATGIETKGKNDFVTYVDKLSEEHLVRGLSQIIPGSAFITEEETIKKASAEYVWIVDPIDGTTNFIHGAPPYSISVGLMHNNVLTGGFVYEITADECFYACGGRKAYMNGNEIHVSETRLLKDSLLATGFPYTDFGRMKAFMETMDFFFHNTHGVRRLGSAAADLAYVACGRYDGFYEYNLKPYDVAGGAYILMQAGGCVSDFKGGSEYLFGGELVASNKHIADEFQQAVGNIMNKL
jgi:myo-inositol-1(or 4)-monophosphatase